MGKLDEEELIVDEVDVLMGALVVLELLVGVDEDVVAALEGPEGPLQQVS